MIRKKNIQAALYDLILRRVSNFHSQSSFCGDSSNVVRRAIAELFSDPCLSELERALAVVEQEWTKTKGIAGNNLRALAHEMERSKAAFAYFQRHMQQRALEQETLPGLTLRDTNI